MSSVVTTPIQKVMVWLSSAVIILALLYAVIWLGKNVWLLFQ